MFKRGNLVINHRIIQIQYTKFAWDCSWKRSNIMQLSFVCLAESVIVNSAVLWGKFCMSFSNQMKLPNFRSTILKAKLSLYKAPLFEAVLQNCCMPQPPRTLNLGTTWMCHTLRPGLFTQRQQPVRQKAWWAPDTGSKLQRKQDIFLSCHKSNLNCPNTIMFEIHLLKNK
jgi:hypothetical protein